MADCRDLNNSLSISFCRRSPWLASHSTKVRPFVAHGFSVYFNPKWPIFSWWQANDSSYRAAPSMNCGKEEMIGAVKLKFLEPSVGWRDRVRLWVIFFLLWENTAGGVIARSAPRLNLDSKLRGERRGPFHKHLLIRR